MNTIVVCPSCGTKNRVPSVADGLPRCGGCKQPLPWIVNAGDRDFDQVASSKKVVVLVDLWAPWCGPCLRVSPALERLATERAGRLKLVKVNVDDSPQVQAEFGVQGIPTLVLLSEGREVGRQTGALPIEQLRIWVDRHLPR